jgi:hypothetical protein
VPPHYPGKSSYDKFLHVIHVASSPIDSSYTQEDHAARLVKQIQPLQQKVHNILQQAKQSSFFSKESNSPRFRFIKSFLEDLMQWIPLHPKGGGYIQVKIDGYPPIPLTQNMGFHLGNVSTVF